MPPCESRTSRCQGICLLMRTLPLLSYMHLSNGLIRTILVRLYTRSAQVGWGAGEILFEVVYGQVEEGNYLSGKNWSSWMTIF